MTKTKFSTDLWGIIEAQEAVCDLRFGTWIFVLVLRPILFGRVSLPRKYIRGPDPEKFFLGAL